MPVKKSFLKIGMVSPYGWDTPGGVQTHIRDLAQYYISQGHDVSVLTPASNDKKIVEPFVISAGRPISIPYNGAVARVLFGPVAASRVRQWISQGNFDVLHLHEPAIPSLSLLACWLAEGPMVGTFHAAAPRQKVAFAVSPLLEPVIEKLRARIAVSEVARETLKIHLETDAVVIPNGISRAFFKEAKPKPEWERPFSLAFIGRFAEPRKGLQTLIESLAIIARFISEVHVFVAGPGESEEFIKSIDPELRTRMTFLGRISDKDKARLLKSVTLFIAPNTGGESFGITIAEALASGTGIVASDLPAFAALLEHGKYGTLFAKEDAPDLARVVIDLLRDDEKRKSLASAGAKSAEKFDWSVVAEQVMDIYHYSRFDDEQVRLVSDSRPWNRFFTKDSHNETKSKK